MSLHLAAQHLIDKGRGPDDTLVHMSKGELQSLQQLAKAHGGTLTTNPDTGLPEAGFLSKLLPTLIGGALVASGVGTPLAAAMLVGGGEAIATGSLGKGLMAGLGAYGGAGLTEGLMSSGAAGIGADAYAAQNAAAMAPEAAQNVVSGAMDNASSLDKLSAGAKQFANNPMDAIRGLGNGSAMKGAGVLASATLPSMLGDAPAPTTKTYPVANKLIYNPNPQQTNPNAGVPGYGHQGQNFGGEQVYFNPSYTDTGSPYKPIGMAAGGEIELHGSFNAGGGQDGGGFGSGNYTPMGGGFGGKNPGFAGGNTAQNPQQQSGPMSGLSGLFNQGMAGPGGYGGFDPRAIQANPQGFMQNMNGAQQQEQQHPGSTYLSNFGGQNDQPFGLFGGKSPQPSYEQYLASRSPYQEDVQLSKEQYENPVSGGTPDNYFADGGAVNPYAEGGTTKFEYDKPKQMVNQTFSQWMAAHPEAQTQTQVTPFSVEKNYNVTPVSQLVPAAKLAPATTDLSQFYGGYQFYGGGDSVPGPVDTPVDAPVDAPVDTPVDAPVDGVDGGDDARGGFYNHGKFDQRPKGISAYAMGGSLGGYSDGGHLLRGPGDGVSDSIPAVIGNRQPARLADGEFVVPARIVSELGNGSTEAGARKLYAMMDRIQHARGKTVGKGKVATNSRADKHLPA